MKNSSNRTTGVLNPSHHIFAYVYDDKRLNTSCLHTNLFRINSSFKYPAKLTEMHSSVFLHSSLYYPLMVTVSILFNPVSKSIVIHINK